MHILQTDSNNLLNRVFFLVSTAKICWIKFISKVVYYHSFGLSCGNFTLCIKLIFCQLFIFLKNCSTITVPPHEIRSNPTLNKSILMFTCMIWICYMVFFGSYCGQIHKKICSFRRTAQDSWQQLDVNGDSFNLFRVYCDMHKTTKHQTLTHDSHSYRT
jgi:uncharacterized membrane protein